MIFLSGGGGGVRVRVRVGFVMGGLHKLRDPRMYPIPEPQKHVE